ncbi:Uncharacterized protein DBV15_00985 [Temnothorax longispinosus]|nr:Uncharacterized protein DBV15_00985 [Temnothorax longispinosus]
MIRPFLERFFKVRTKQDAIQLRRRLSIFYAVVGWHCFGLAFYVIMKREMPEDAHERRMAIGLLSPIPHTTMHVYQISGLTLTNDFDIAYKAKLEQIERETKEGESPKTDEN